MTSLIDPDCRDRKHGSCIGGPCQCPCHQQHDCQSVDPVTGIRCQKPEGPHRHGGIDTTGTWRSW